MQKPLTICLLMLVSGFLFSQKIPSSGFPTLISGNYDIGDRLQAIAEDWNGFIWLGTNTGLLKFDGTGTKRYTRSSIDSTIAYYNVMDILIDHDERLIWVATASGLTCFDPENETSRHYFADFDSQNSIADNYVDQVIKDRNGRIWVGCFNHGISLYRKETDDFLTFKFDLPEIDSIQKIKPNINISRLNSITAIEQDELEDDIFWLGTPQGLLRFDYSNNAFKWLFLENKSVGREILSRSVTQIKAINHEIFVGTEGPAYVLDPRDGEISFDFDRDKHPEWPLTYVTHFEVSSDSSVLISYSNGLIEYNTLHDQTDRVFLDEPSENKYYGIRLIDSENRTWVRSSRTMVLYDPDKQIATNYPLDPNACGLPLVFEQVNDSSILLLTSVAQYFHVFNTKAGLWETIEMYNPQINWNDITWKDWAYSDNKYWYLLAEDALYKVRLDDAYVTKVNLDIPFARPSLWKALVDQDHNLWISTIRVGLFKFNLETGKSDHFLEELNSPYSTSLYTWIMDLKEDHKGRIWIRLARSYAVFDKNTEEFTIVPHYEKGEQTFRYVRAFLESPDKEMWMSSMDNGFGKANSDDISYGLLEKYSVEDGLLNNAVYQMNFDQENRLWALTEDGFSVFDTKNDTFQNFAWNRGMEKSTMFLMLSNDQIAIPLKKGGLQIVDMHDLISERIVPRPYTTKINVRDQVHFESGNRIEPQAIEIEKGRDYLSFEFSSLGYTNPKVFAYYLEGVDENWVETNGLSSTSYSNLSPGRYTFHLKSRILGSKWSDVQQTSIYLVPRWWETYWFRAIAVIFLMLCAYAFYRWRIWEVTKHEREKADFQQRMNKMEMQALRSQMNPHFIFNSLNSIQRYIIKNEKMLASDYLERFARLMRLILQNSRSALVPLQNELEALKLYMDLEKLRVSEKFDYSIQIDSSVNVHNLEIPPMILQPFIENAIWHGIQPKEGQGEIRIHLKQEDEILLITLEDNGIGRKASTKLKQASGKKHKSFGMKITRDRLDAFNQTNKQGASVKINDLVDSAGNACGTQVKLQLPI